LPQKNTQNHTKGLLNQFTHGLRAPRIPESGTARQKEKKVRPPFFGGVDFATFFIF
jgi:hypothetical protein